MIIKQDSVAPLKSLYVPILSTLIAPWTACNLVFEINRNNLREQIQHHQGLLLPLNSMGRVSKLEMRADGGASRKKPAHHKCRRHKRCRFDPWVGKIPWRRAWQPTPVFFPGESHGWKSVVGYSPWGSEESDTTE